VHDPPFERLRFLGLEGGLGRGDLAGAAHLELVSGVVQLRPEDAMFEAMLRGWRAQQTARGLREDTIAPRERLVRRFLAFADEYPWNWGSSQVEEWTQSLVAERRLAPSTIRGYQTDLRLFSEYLCDGRYGWAAACEGEFGPGAHPVPVCHEWNTIAHLNGYEGRPEARPFSREELQLFLDYADDQVDRAVRAKRKGALAAYRGCDVVQGHLRLGAAPDRGVAAGCGGLGPQPGRAGVRPARDAARPLWQGQARPAAAAP
jgi:integrase/recombinase XerC